MRSLPRIWFGFSLAGPADMRCNTNVCLADNSFVVTSVPIQSEELPYGTYTPDNRDQMPSVSAEGFKEFSLPPEHPFRPVRMEVHDKSDVRGKIPSRICLLGANGTTLQTFSMSD